MAHGSSQMTSELPDRIDQRTGNIKGRASQIRKEAFLIAVKVQMQIFCITACCFFASSKATLTRPLHFF
jgi:hypothetical protein